MNPATRALPPPAGDRAKVTSWSARLACDADQRTKYPEYRDLAALLRVVDGEVHAPDLTNGEL